MLSICANLERSWLSTCLIETNWLSLTRFRSFSACFQTKWRAQPTLSVLDGEKDSSVRTSRWPINHGTFLRAVRYFDAVIAGATPASRRAPSWSVPIRRFRCSSVLRTSLPARRQTCRPPSSSASSSCRATKPHSRYFTSCTPAWCIPTKTGSAASRMRSPRPTKPGLTVASRARATATTIWCSWHAQSKSGNTSVQAASTSERPGVSPGASDSPWCQTGAQSRWSASSATMAPARAPCSSCGPTCQNIPAEAIQAKCKVAPQIEVGADQVRDLTGRENIYLNGAILGIP